LAAWLEITLCWPGRKALTTSRFIWKVNTHFTMLAPQLIPSALTSSVSSILQFPTEAVRPVRSLRHMTTQLLQEAAQVIPNQQTLINVVSKRVRQLGLGHRPLIETAPRMSLTDIALKEIIAGKLTYESLEGTAAGALEYQTLLSIRFWRPPRRTSYNFAGGLDARDWISAEDSGRYNERRPVTRIRDRWQYGSRVHH
jgi:DNA-directed RNA polymerase subunit omega